MSITTSGTWERSQPGAWASASSHPRKSLAKKVKDMSLKRCHQSLRKPNPTGSEANCFKNKGQTRRGRSAE